MRKIDPWPGNMTPGRMSSGVSSYGARKANSWYDGEGQTSSTGLVGRDHELEDIAGLVRSARSGKGGAMVLRGEPGTGKTALLESAVTMAPDMNIVRLRGVDDPGADPDVQLRRILDPFMHDARFRLDDEALPHDLFTGRNADGLAQHERRGRRGAHAGPASLAMLLLELFRRAAVSTSSPVLVAVDDVQWLPEQLLRALVEASLQIREEPVAAVLAWSDIPYVQIAAPELAGLDERHLAGLSLEQARSLLQSHGAVPPARQVLTSIVDQTLGNPYGTIDSCARLSDDELGGWRPLPAPLRIGSSLATMFGRCLTSLPEATRNALCIVAASPELPLGVAETAVDHLVTDSPEMLEELIEPARQAGVIAMRNGRVHFDHPLVGAAAFQLAGEELRRSAHEALARAFSARGDVERTVVHAAAGTSGKSGRVARLLTQASHIALSRDDPTTAAVNEEMASDFAVEADGAAHHLAVAARIWTQEGQHERAIGCLDRALLRAISDTTRADVRYWRARARLATDGGPDVAAELLAAGRACSHTAPHRAVMMLADSTACDLLAGRYNEAAESAQFAIDLAGSVSSHFEALAGAVLDLARARNARLHSTNEDGSNGRDPVPTVTSGAAPSLTETTSLVMSHTQGFAGSAQLALAIGLGLLEEVLQDQAARWASWTERCAHTARDRPLLAAALIVRSSVAFQQGYVDDALAVCEAAGRHAETCGQDTLTAHSLGLQVELEAALGLRDRCFEHATRVLAIPAGVANAARVRALAALGELELQRGDSEAAIAWLSASRHEAASLGAMTPGPRHVDNGAFDHIWAPPLIEALALSGRDNLARDLLASGSAAQSPGCVTGAPATWLEATSLEQRRRAYLLGMLSTDAAEASESFSRALASAPSMPLLAARTELRWGQVLSQAGQLPDAEEHLETARSSFASLGARGWAGRALEEVEALRSTSRGAQSSSRGRDRLISGRETGTGEPRTPMPRQIALELRADTDETGETGETGSPLRGASHKAALPRDAATIGLPDVLRNHHRRADAGRPPAWQIVMLGSFSLRYRGIEVTLPPSLPAQAIKVIAIRQRLLVDELVEILWPDAGPGVGTRRLRNVLFRVRAACGDLLARDGAFIRISPEAEVDITAFRSLADRALSRQASPADAVTLAAEALSWYGGELLPGDRYADWAAAARESLAQLHLHLMDLLVNDAIQQGRTAEALGMLEHLIDIDPYEEHHYLLAARLHADNGNRRRAMSALARAERAMLELGVPPSGALNEYRSKIESS